METAAATSSSFTDEQLDRILGVIYGNALGDAVGLATEFLDRKEVLNTFGDLKEKIIPFPNKKRNEHSIRWDLGDWTDDTDQLILIMESLTESKLKADVLDFGEKLEEWMYHGFKDLGDRSGMGIGFTVMSVVRNLKFDKDPHKAAEEVWIKNGKNLAANGALMRTAITGVVHFDNIDTVIHNTLEFCKVTHVDTRCTASCVAVTTLIALMLQGKYKLPSQNLANEQTVNIGTKSDDDTSATPHSTAATTTSTTTTTTSEKDYAAFDIEKLLKEALDYALKHLDKQNHYEVFMKYFNAKSSEELYLDEASAIGYTLKCMGSALFCFKSLHSNNGTKDDFKWLINEIVRYGGDADTNACVCGALMGCRLGYSNLPKDWLSGLPPKNRAWLDKKVIDFCKELGFQEERVSKILDASQ